jgi:OmpA-OmpF porin, OOP family
VKRLIATAILSTGLLGSSAASAQNWVTGKFYVGAAFGQSDVETSVTAPLITSGTVDGKDSAFKIFGGLQFHPNFAAEIAYVDLGSMNYSGSFLGIPVTNGSVDITGFSASAVGRLLLGEAFSLHGKVGFWGWDQKARDTTGGIPFSDSATGSDIFYGVGATYQVTKMIGVRAEWEQFKMDSDKANLATLGVLFRF